MVLVEWWHALAVVLVAIPLGAVGGVIGSHLVPTPPAAPSPLAVELAAELAAVRAEWAAWRKQVEAYLDSFEELSETVERRRRRAAASASRQITTQESDSSPEGLRRRARAMGLPI